jgi:hypothetical protein
VTRNKQTDRVTIEELAHGCLDIRELRRRDFLNDRRVEIGPSIRWPKLARMRIEPYRIQLKFWHQVTTQYVRISWTKVHLGGERPRIHCPHCQTRVARLYAGLGGYFCRACIGNPPYASQQFGARKARPRRRRTGRCCEVSWWWFPVVIGADLSRPPTQDNTLMSQSKMQ